MNNAEIKKIKLVDINDKNFYKKFLSEQKPILITNIFEHFYLLEKWNLEYLSSKLNNKTIKVNFSKDGIYNFSEKTGKHGFISKDIGFDSFIEALSQKKSKEKIYAQKISILRDLPELKEELKIIDYIPNEYLHSANLWVGSGGNTSPLHFDYFNNFFIQLFGHKTFWLYSPEDFSSLYPNSWSSMAPHLSKIDPSNLDGVKYPNSLKARQIKINVYPGSILFLPSYWWHQVYSVNTSISVNIWCEPSFRQKIVFAHFHSCLSTVYAKLRYIFE